MARNGGIEVGKKIMNEEYKPKIIFYQNLKLFKFYISCIGDYNEDKNNNNIISLVRENNEKNDIDYLKLNFIHILDDDCFYLVGAIVIGSNLIHYKIGNIIYDLVFSKKKYFNNDHLQLIDINFEWVVKKKFINPLKKN
jgi:hypothetical protein